jgi:hypothetical protein
VGGGLYLGEQRRRGGDLLRHPARPLGRRLLSQLREEPFERRREELAARRFEVPRSAGARGLVLSLWPVSDAATVKFMTLFYDKL